MFTPDSGPLRKDRGIAYKETILSDAKFKDLLEFLVVAIVIGLLAYGNISATDVIALSPALKSYLK